ncbi:sugar transporter [Bifidobacterium reuteri DSM 23975]|uniref:Sugar transporter n=1 Tax=Bifidobacterium reuteri DSM 23975 TaxID=1437610 RepID=A0A087CPQ1_9BIFI|nr:sugar porter family MFS transporter [Bifidobacterium reuteri]KFI85251.1 sugar transporter [Bifidobacterium reuteri DSM 23975]
MAGLFQDATKHNNPLGTAIRTQGSGKYTFGLALSAGLAGLLYGYDTVSISGAIEFLDIRYGLSTFMEGFVISSIMVGAMVGAAAAGFLSDTFGRRRILIIGGGFFFVAAIWSALTVGPIDLIVSRMVGGFGIGLTAALAVTYITESAPTNIRGLLSFSYQMLAVCGIFLTNVINYIIASYGSHHWDVTTGWRWMLGLGAIPAAAFLLAMLHAPESPRFLIQVGKTDEGFAVLEHILGTERARLKVDDINASVKLEHEMSREFHDLFRPGLRKALGIGIFLAVFNQLIGMNAISYYGPVMFSNLGFKGDTEFLTAACVGGVELVATVIGLYLIDTFGRKRLMEVGAGMMCAFAFCIAISYAIQSALLTFVFVIAFTASFAFSMGPIPWIVIPELFPTYLRGRATGLCVMSLLFANWIIAQFTPLMIDGWGGGISFTIFGAVNLICLLGIVKLVPETMGRTLEEIEHLWQPKTPLAAAKYALSSADANIRHAEATLRRVENERLQALGIMTAAERARIGARQKMIELQTQQNVAAMRRDEARHDAAEDLRAEQLKHTAGHPAVSDARLAAGAYPSVSAFSGAGGNHGDSHSGRHMVDEPANIDDATMIVPESLAAVQAEAAAHAVANAPVPSTTHVAAPAPPTTDATVAQPVAPMSEPLPARPVVPEPTQQQVSISALEQSRNGNGIGVILPDTTAPSYDAAEAEDARETKAINQALDSLDALIKA